MKENEQIADEKRITFYLYNVEVGCSIVFYAH